MTLPVSGEPEQTAREWQDGDRAWKHDAVWRRLPYGGPMPWSSDHFGNRKRCSDFDMTAAGAVLLATAEGPVPVGDVRQEWGWIDPADHGVNPISPERLASFNATGLTLVRRTVSTSPWVAVPDGE